MRRLLVIFLLVVVVFTVRYRWKMATIAAPKCLVVSATARHTATVIFMHGLGDTGHGWKPVADIFKADPAFHHVKWILPHAPNRRVTANMGMEMPAWFDIYSFGFKAAEDEAGMLESASSISKLIDAEVQAGIPENRIVLGGFSQGAAMSLLTGLQPGRKLAGIVSLSGWLPLKERVIKTATSESSSIRIFVGHGSDDPLVKPEFMERSLEVLAKDLKFTVNRNTSEYSGISVNVYEGMEHSSCPEELRDLKAWLAKAVPDQ